MEEFGCMDFHSWNFYDSCHDYPEHDSEKNYSSLCEKYKKLRTILTNILQDNILLNSALKDACKHLEKKNEKSKNIQGPEFIKRHRKCNKDLKKSIRCIDDQCGKYYNSIDAQTLHTKNKHPELCHQLTAMKKKTMIEDSKKDCID